MPPSIPNRLGSGSQRNSAGSFRHFGRSEPGRGTSSQSVLAGGSTRAPASRATISASRYQSIGGFTGSAWITVSGAGGAPGCAEGKRSCARGVVTPALMCAGAAVDGSSDGRRNSSITSVPRLGTLASPLAGRGWLRRSSTISSAWPPSTSTAAAHRTRDSRRMVSITAPSRHPPLAMRPDMRALVAVLVVRPGGRIFVPLGSALRSAPHARA